MSFLWCWEMNAASFKCAPVSSYSMISSSSVPATKRCALEMAISRQASIIFNSFRLIYQLCTSYFPWTSTLVETRKTDKCHLTNTVGNTAFIHNVSIQFF